MTVRDWPPLSDVQLLALQWVRDGADQGNPPSETYKSTAVALAARDLIELDRRKGHWRAELTTGGVFYLEHGHFEGHPPLQRLPKQPRPAKPTAPEGHAAGPLHEPEEPETTEAVPATESHELEPSPLTVATQLRGLHPAVRAVVDRKLPAGMSAEHRRRAHLLLHTLAREAQQRGWAIGRPKERSSDLITIDAGDLAVSIRMRLRTKRVDHVKSAQELAAEERRGYNWGPKYDYLSTDEMILTLGSGTEYRDTARAKLESKLLAVLERIDAESAHAREWSEKRRLQEEEQARRLERAVQRRARADEYGRWVTNLNEFTVAWREHAELVAFLAELRAGIDGIESPERRRELERFIAWADGHIERTAPLIAHRLPGEEPPTAGFEEWVAGAHEDQPPDWSWMMPRN